MGARRKQTKPQVRILAAETILKEEGVIELIVNYKKVKHFGLCAGWFGGEPFALFEIVLFEVNTEVNMIDLVRIKLLKLSVDLYVDWQ